MIQYPIILAYAITIHKSQGMTYNKIACNVNLCFEPGQAYYYFLAMLVLYAIACPLRKSPTNVCYIVPMYVLGLTLAQMLVEVAGRYHYSIIPMLILIAASNEERQLKCCAYDCD